MIHVKESFTNYVQWFFLSFILFHFWVNFVLLIYVEP
jgi:hypothetical protein